MVERAPRSGVELWTDGGCYPNPGPGAWAFILVMYRARTPSPEYPIPFKKVAELERAGRAEQTTNNAMELTAAIRGLQALQRPTTLAVYSDSAYVINCMTQRWHVKWQIRQWRKQSGGEVANRALWEQLLIAARPHTIDWQHVKGHSGSHYNERCDRLCTATYREAA